MVNMLRRMFRDSQKEWVWTEAAWIIRSWQSWGRKAAASYCCTPLLLLGCVHLGFEMMTEKLVLSYLPGGHSGKP